MFEYPREWTCELVVLRLERYIFATLPHGEALAVAEHIEACMTCAQRLVQMEPIGGSARRSD